MERGGSKKMKNLYVLPLLDIEAQILMSQFAAWVFFKYVSEVVNEKTTACSLK